MIKQTFTAQATLAAVAIVSGLVLALPPATAQLNMLAQSEKPDQESAGEGEASRAMTWAKETGEIAGGANFCQLDSEDVENFISQALARIAAEAHDDVDQVVSRITFNNTVDTSSVKEPKGGCENFPEVFARELARLSKD